MNKLALTVVFLLGIHDLKAQEIILNEVSPSVTNSQVDNYGEFADWVELYNRSESDIDLAGWYLSDNPARPLKWRIPEGNPRITVIRAGSYLLLWADKDTLQGPDHLGFALKSKGECLLLYRPGKNGPVLEDSVKYDAVTDDESFGRCPERNNEWTGFKHPTPGRPNICPPEKIRKTGNIPCPVPADPLSNWFTFPQSSDNAGNVMTINELSCNNKYSLSDEYGENDDWIELYNAGVAPVNIAGWYISDTLNTTLFHRIPSWDPGKTTIPAGGYLILWADGQSAQGVTHLPFKLDKDGEEVYLAKLTGGQYSIIDEIAFPKAKNDVTYGRIPNGTGIWKRLSDPTPAGPNIPARIIGGFIVNELMAVAGPGLVDESGEEEDWIEFYNPSAYPVNLGGLYLTDSIDDPIKSHITVFSKDSTTIPPGGHLVFFADNETWQGARHLNFKLPAKGSDIFIFQPDGMTEISQTTYSFQAGDASFGRYPDGSAGWIYTVPTPGQPNRYKNITVDGLFINELMANNISTFPDTFGGIEDWVEIYNGNQVPVDIGGLYLTDSLADPLKFRISGSYPDSTTIPARGFMTFWADNHPERGIRHLDFKLSASGESVGLSRFADGRAVIVDSITYPAQSEDVSYGRLGDGAPWWGWFRTSSPDAPNSSQSSPREDFGHGSVTVYPNPCSDRFSIRIFLDSPSAVQVDFFNLRGGKVYGLHLTECDMGWNTLHIDHTGDWLRSGSYFLKISTENRSGYCNLVVVK